MASNDEVPLREAPDRFFDPDLWSVLVARRGGKELAISLFSTNAGGLEHLNSLVAEMPTSAGAQAREREAQYEIRDQLLTEITRRLVAAELIGTGILATAGERRTIPRELWSELRMNFETGTATSARFEYLFVHIGNAKNSMAAKEALRGRVRAWLQAQQQANRRERKHSLKARADKHFAPDLTVRIFDQEYAEVYAYRRGRPPDK